MTDITIKTLAEINLLREGGRRLVATLQELAGLVAPGITPRALDARARALVASLGDEPSFLGYHLTGAPAPFPAALCVSVNDVVVHGIPSDAPFAAGDVVSLDLGLCHASLYTDMAVTVIVGEGGAARPEAERLVAATREALAAGIAAARAGAHLGDIGYAVATVARREGLGLVRDLGGHGVGHAIHEEPMIPNYGRRGGGLLLRPGMVLAIEPMFTLGSGKVTFLPDGYTVVTSDRSLAAHCEHTVAITDAEPVILTDL